MGVLDKLAIFVGKNIATMGSRTFAALYRFYRNGFFGTFLEKYVVKSKVVLSKIGVRIGGKTGAKISGLATGGFLNTLAKTGKWGAVGSIASDVTRFAAQLETVDYIIVDWYNNYIENLGNVQSSGALSTELAFSNLRALMFELVVLENFMGDSEISELFTEGLGNAMGEMLEKQLLGELSLNTNLRYGSRELDSDSISEACEGRWLEEQYHHYEIAASGAYNTTGTYTFAKGVYRGLTTAVQMLHQDIFYGVMKGFEMYQSPADVLLDEARELYKDRLYNKKEDLTKGINKVKGSILTALSAAKGIRLDMDTYTDEEWLAVTDSLKHNQNKTFGRYISNIGIDYEVYVLPEAQDWDRYLSLAEPEFNELVLKHNSMRAEQVQLLINSEQIIYNKYKEAVDNCKEDITSIRNDGVVKTYNTFSTTLYEPTE